MKKLILLTLLASIAFAEQVLVTETIEITTPYRERVNVGEQCYDTRVHRSGHYQSQNEIGLDTLIGATIGVAVGNQFHNHKDAAKVVGGIVGATTANNMRPKHHHDNFIEYETKCTPKYDYITSHRVTGYRNCAWIDGKRYCVKSKHPRRYLNVRRHITVY